MDKDDGRFISTAIDEILEPVGKVLHSFLEPQRTNSTLKAVTLFNRQNFITELEVPITPQVSFTLKLDYEGLQLRCRLCLAVQHSAQDCPHRLPSPRQPPHTLPARVQRQGVNTGADNTADRSIDLNTRPPRSISARGRPDKGKRRQTDSNSSSSTGSSIKHYEELHRNTIAPERVPTPSRSTSSADTHTERRRSSALRHKDSQRKPDSTPDTRGRLPTHSGHTRGQGILPLPGLPLSQGIMLQTPAHTTFNRVYSAYIPPPIAAIIGNQAQRERFDIHALLSFPT
ncbi:hypothetical protein R1sor_020312 [Riccia sorocarpa]|uniref:Zinc knuckle CX2CX4HX4C domain-containing protein n=1 Tax=Riccia sorocarpa TaxID=122646 RepID=A0ABD3IIT3_9MARC